MALKKSTSINLLCLVIIILALVGGVFLYAKSINDQNQAIRATARTAILKHLDNEAVIKKLLPYFAPTTVSNTTWESDFYSTGCESTRMPHNYIDVSDRITSVSDYINQMNDGLSESAVQNKTVSGVSNSAKLLNENQQSFQQILGQNEQLRQLALDEYGNECGMGRTYSQSTYGQNNSTAGRVIDKIRLESSQVNQNDAQINAEMN